VKPHLKKIHHKKGLVEWLKMKALSSSPCTKKKKKKRKSYKTVNKNGKNSCNIRNLRKLLGY
jgi:ribosomal protein S21